MESFILPEKFEWAPGAKPNEKILTIEPCYFGYGTTLGNALRRVLLSSLPGAAVTAVKIDGVAHEFSAIPHVQEEAIEILLNMKQLRMTMTTDDPVHLTMDVHGKRELTAADFVTPPEVEIVNRDLHIATLTHRDATLRIEVIAQRGRGYSITENRPRERGDIGLMAIDAVFTPVRNVGFRVENTRVGDITNYDRLLLTVETDGTITPEDAVTGATRMLMDHFRLILEPPQPPTVDAPSTPPSLETPATPAVEHTTSTTPGAPES